MCGCLILVTATTMGGHPVPLAVEDVRAKFERLRSLGVRFTQEPLEMGTATAAVFDDTCGNLIQIAQAT